LVEPGTFFFCALHRLGRLLSASAGPGWRQFMRRCSAGSAGVRRSPAEPTRSTDEAGRPERRGNMG